MEESAEIAKGENIVCNETTFTVPFALEEIKEDITITTHIYSNTSQEQIINQAIKLHLQGNIKEAYKFYKYCLNQNFNDHRVFSNFSLILKDLGKLQEAELSLRKAIKLNPDFAEAHSNLGAILIDLGRFTEAELSLRKAIRLKPNYVEAHSNLGTLLTNQGKLKEAELSLCKAIDYNSDFAKAYYSLSTLKYSEDSKSWQKKLFSKSMLTNKTQENKIDIYFARANVFHNEKNYIESSKNFKSANNLKLNLKPSKPDLLFNKSQLLLIETDKIKINNEKNINNPMSIFIVGMPRSGSTLIESILSMNTNIHTLGESNILEEAYLKLKKFDQELSLAKEYWQQAKHSHKIKITINKFLYNYQYAGIIAKRIPNAKIIHCFRHPLDNILSLYITHFARGNEYSSSLIDSARVYLNQEEIMDEYKSRFKSNIYEVNYDLLVRNPNQEIKSMISWLDFEWDDSYLSPHLNPGVISTASNVQVRAPINQSSIGRWKNYIELLKPAIEILNKTKKYSNFST